MTQLLNQRAETRLRGRNKGESPRTARVNAERKLAAQHAARKDLVKTGDVQLNLHIMDALRRYWSGRVTRKEVEASIAKIHSLHNKYFTTVKAQKQTKRLRGRQKGLQTKMITQDVMKMRMMKENKKRLHPREKVSDKKSHPPFKLLEAKKSGKKSLISIHKRGQNEMLKGNGKRKEATGKESTRNKEEGAIQIIKKTEEENARSEIQETKREEREIELIAEEEQITENLKAPPDAVRMNDDEKTGTSSSEDQKSDSGANASAATSTAASTKTDAALVALAEAIIAPGNNDQIAKIATPEDDVIRAVLLETITILVQISREEMMNSAS